MESRKKVFVSLVLLIVFLVMPFVLTVLTEQFGQVTYQVPGNVSQNITTTSDSFIYYNAISNFVSYILFLVAVVLLISVLRELPKDQPISQGVQQTTPGVAVEKRKSGLSGLLTKEIGSKQQPQLKQRQYQQQPYQQSQHQQQYQSQTQYNPQQQYQQQPVQQRNVQQPIKLDPLQCPSCGGLFLNPGPGKTVKCPHCFAVGET